MAPLNKIDLIMHAPAHEEIYVAAGAAVSVNVSMSGEVLSTGHGATPLFLKWYSSLQGDLGAMDSINPALMVGSHVITFTAQDKNDAGVPPDDLAALYASMEYIGNTGGPLAEANPCVIHVFAANMIAPDSGTASISKGVPLLEAQAPIQWAEYPDYITLNPLYHEVNKIRYRWFFRHESSPAGSGIELDTQNGDLLQLLPSDDTYPSRLHFTGMLPEELIEGDNYYLTLRVENIDDASQGHEVTRLVNVTA